ncbi:MAG: hypothetical protein K5634_04965 [Sphaerochaetaceae bacterium]|nr:hypothetical protein [Sphaerochaetaceae bacterium]
MGDVKNMTLDQMREEIVDFMYERFKAYELPEICKTLMLKPGDVEEAMKSKREFTRKRLKGKTKTEIIEVLQKLRDITGEDLIPEHRYTYSISSITKKEIVKVLTTGVAGMDRVFGDTANYSIDWYGDVSEIEVIKKVCDISLIPVLDSRCKSFEEEYYRHRVYNEDWDSNYFFEDERLPFKKANTEKVNEILCVIFSPYVRKESGQWRIIKEMFWSSKVVTARANF